jgi:hypothetical protein
VGVLPSNFDLPSSSLVVVGYCHNCWLTCPCKVYTDLDALEWAADVQPWGSPFNDPKVVVGWKPVVDFPDARCMSEPELGLVLPETKLDLGGLCDYLQGRRPPRGRPNRSRALGTILGPVYPWYDWHLERPVGARLMMRVQESEASTGRWGEGNDAHVWMGADGEVSVTWSGFPPM